MNLEADTCSLKEYISAVLNNDTAEKNIYLTPTANNCVVKPFQNVRCPHCGENYYQENYTTTTAVYYPPIYKDGVNINPDRNQSTTFCTCLNCGKEFTY